MKKVLSVLLCVFLLLCLMGCSQEQEIAEEDVYVEEEVSSADTDVPAATDEIKMNGPMKMGKYEGFWTGGVNDAYGYITLNADGTCYIETNIDQSGNYITPVAENGTYELFESEEFYPDGTTVMQTMISLYLIDGTQFATYICNPAYDKFEDQWSGYEYVGN